MDAMKARRRLNMFRRTVRATLILGLSLVFSAWGVSARQTPAPVFKDTTALPEGPAGARIKSLIEVLNSGSADRITRFLNDECAKGFREAAPGIRVLLAKLKDKDWFSGTVLVAKGANYGYGFTVVASPGGKAVGHSGGFDGINSQLDIYVETSCVVAAMSNIGMGASPLANKIGSILARVKGR
jgi:hypothetical protein